jgi:amino acid transporter
VLGLVDCVLLVLGAIIGSGISLTPGGIARTTQNTTAVFFVWTPGGILTFCGALSYWELGAAYPRAGGMYAFLREAYGRTTAFLFGWCVLWVMVTGSIATLASAFAILISITGAMNSNVLGGPRVFCAMAHEKLFFRWVAYIHPGITCRPFPS